MGFGLLNLTGELDQHSPPGSAISHILGNVVDQLYLHTATKNEVVFARVGKWKGVVEKWIAPFIALDFYSETVNQKSQVKKVPKFIWREQWNLGQIANLVWLFVLEFI